ncbi:hypothetical protein FG93_01437 [Bosea sp. LC85]|nr:hypothetical protein FG93_01437 [Bosea sp. LC85]
MSGDRVTFRAVRDGVVTEIPADAIEIGLPDGLSFRIMAFAGRKGAAALHMSADHPDAPSFDVFSVEPGAANTLFVSVERVRKRQMEG